MGKGAFNRIKGDVGNILAMEHVNVTVPDQGLATLFYVNGLGLTRDPYIDFGTFNVWINAGRQQFHLPTAEAQVLRFRESARANQHYDGHHIAIYIADFSGPHAWLDRAGLISEESDECQYRFQHIVDPSSGRILFEIEHEVRSLFHPMWERHLVNRNAEQSFFHYQKDRDAFTPGKLPTG